MDRASGRSLSPKSEFYSKAQANKVIKLVIIWLQIGQAGKIERTSTWPSFSSQYFVNKIQKRNLPLNSQLRRDKFFVQFLSFLTKFLSAKVTKLARFCKQKPWREKSLMPVGVYRGITDRQLTNQSARTIATI